MLVGKGVSKSDLALGVFLTSHLCDFVLLSSSAAFQIPQVYPSFYMDS